jgi:hypothetical protein
LHAVPHAPQCALDVPRFTQPIDGPQFVNGAVQVQTPAAQPAPGPQALLQLPQWLGSFDGWLQPDTDPQ